MAAAAAMTNTKSHWEGRSSSEAAAGTTTDASPEARWPTERIGGGDGLVSGRGQCGLNISYNRLGRGDGVLRRWQRGRQEKKGKVGTHFEEV